MGGIAFDIPKTEVMRFLPINTIENAKETWFLKKYGISLLAKHEVYRDILPNLSKEEIKSKSKANAIAKTLVCAQALWFIAQCITRGM